ncbi:MAG: TonB family protein [Pseudomonadota bacterium]
MKLLTLSDRLVALGMTSAVYGTIVPALFLLTAGIGLAPARPGALKTFDIALPALDSEPRTEQKAHPKALAREPRAATRIVSSPPGPPTQTSLLPARPSLDTPVLREPALASVPAPMPSPPAQPAPKVEGPTPEDASLLRSYAARLWAHIAARRPPGIRLEGTTIVAFTVSRSGLPRSVSIAKPSGNAMLDRLALRTIRQAAPLPPPPPLDDSQLRFTIAFSFT